MAHASFNWQDTFLLDLQLSDDERMVRDAAAAYSQDKLLPRVTQAFCEGTTEPDHGSDPGSMATRVHKVAGGYKLSASGTVGLRASITGVAAF